MNRKTYPFYLLSAFFLGILGALFRGKQLVSAFDSETGILLRGEPETIALLICFVFSFVGAVAFALLTKKDCDVSTSPRSDRFIRASFFISAVIVLFFAFLKFIELQNGFMVTTLILALLSVYCSVSLFALGKYGMRERDSAGYCVFAVVPVFWACYLLVLLFRDKIPDPILADYVFAVFAYIFVLLIAYGISANVLGKCASRLTVFSCFLGMSVMMTELFSRLASNLFFGGAFEFTVESFAEWLPILAFLLLIPAVSGKISKR